jgi:hypothetical protein
LVRAAEHKETPDCSAEIRDLRGPVSDDDIMSWTRG